MFNKLLNTKEGKIIISIIWGFGISCLFKIVYNQKKCIIYKAPNPNKIIKKFIKLTINVINLLQIILNVLKIQF